MPTSPGSLMEPRTWARGSKNHTRSTTNHARDGELGTKNGGDKDDDNEDDEDFLISTDPSILQPNAINAAFGMDFLYWAKPLPEDTLDQLLRGSLCFGLYQRRRRTPQERGGPRSGDQVGKHAERHTTATHHPPGSPAVAATCDANSTLEQIGLARIITDTVTFAYLTDVYVLPPFQGLGLGQWLIDCVADTLSLSSMPYMRRVMLMTSGERTEEFYARALGMRVVGYDESRALGRRLSLMCSVPGRHSPPPPPSSH